MFILVLTFFLVAANGTIQFESSVINTNFSTYEACVASGESAQVDYPLHGGGAKIDFTCVKVGT